MLPLAQLPGLHQQHQLRRRRVGASEVACVTVPCIRPCPQAVGGTGPALLDLHLALGNVEQACAVAESGAQQEQAAGNYKVGGQGLAAGGSHVWAAVRVEGCGLASGCMPGDLGRCVWGEHGPSIARARHESTRGGAYACACVCADMWLCVAWCAARSVGQPEPWLQPLLTPRRASARLWPRACRACWPLGSSALPG